MKKKTDPEDVKKLEKAEIILQNIRNFCAYQERNIPEIEEKLKKWMVDDDKIPEIIHQLKEENYLDEFRYARLYTSGKLRIKKWGKKKIEFELRKKGLPAQAIEEGLSAIDEDEYREILTSLILEKNKEIKGSKSLNNRQKIINFVLNKGFEIDLILNIIKQLKF
ncbi:MAG: regulatory protein RecX [Bacteroidota bacterium]|nr:regulatory protein RecX [Bacteroidota bacterium]